MQWTCRDRALDLGRVCLMGILNVTPDSFSDGGRYFDTHAAVARARKMAAEGATIVDIGGESTRPGSEGVSADEEMRRVMPVIEQLAGDDLIVSIDTSKAAVARAALEAGARVVNDITAMRGDPQMAEAVAQYGAGVVLMHMQGTPRTMQANPIYSDVIVDIGDCLRERYAAALRAGISADRVVFDPGLGFGKTVDHNLEILRRLGEFGNLGRPILVGPSRKSFIGAILDVGVNDRLEGTAAAVAAAVLAGASIVRVHDVRYMLRVVRLCEAIRGRRSQRSEVRGQRVEQENEVTRVFAES
ncbi:dihydropteroate synthase [Candidatus Sumerlaeota bacterium]|nr:dihydropteroate synthase [Candidatus Sumerlaeota bacterium]